MLNIFSKLLGCIRARNIEKAIHDGPITYELRSKGENGRGWYYYIASQPKDYPGKVTGFISETLFAEGMRAPDGMTSSLADVYSYFKQNSDGTYDAIQPTRSSHNTYVMPKNIVSSADYGVLLVYQLGMKQALVKKMYYTKCIEIADKIQRKFPLACNLIVICNPVDVTLERSDGLEDFVNNLLAE